MALMYSTRDGIKLSLVIRMARAWPGRITLSDLAIDAGISLSYAEQLFYELRIAKLVDGLRGPGGGFVLAAPPDEISVYKILDSRIEARGHQDNNLAGFNASFMALCRERTLKDII